MDGGLVCFVLGYQGERNNECLKVWSNLTRKFYYSNTYLWASVYNDFCSYLLGLIFFFLFPLVFFHFLLKKAWFYPKYNKKKKSLHDSWYSFVLRVIR